MSHSSKAPMVPSKEENVYIPSYIKKRPFYASVGEDDDSADYLEHQRLHKSASDSASYERGKKSGPAATKWRKGACENCGAMGHKAKDCLERPRKVGARWTGKDIQADRVVKDIELSWAAKRDQYNGYDARNYRNHVDEYNQMEELRKQMQARKAAEDGEEQEDGDHYAEESDMSKHQPTSTRQLRLREDTAKYLLNLDLDSAKYDPKTRSIVDAGAVSDDKAAQLFTEEGFMRSSGDAADFEQAQRYAWEAQEKRGDTSQHLQANPTAGEFLRKKEKEEAEKKRAERERLLREKYGGSEQAMPAALKEMSVTESESFVEYDEAGLIKGAPKAPAKSKYQEDVYINNHTSVWGSWWSNFQWGYTCCHSFIKNSYCTGEEGKKAWEAAERRRQGVDLDGSTAEQPEKDEDEEQKTVVIEPQEKKAVAERMTKEERMLGISEAEMEEYRRKRTAANDPMAKFLGKDELV